MTLLGELNLDAMEPEDLLDCMGALQTLANYAQLKRSAMLDRLSGEVSRALETERQCDAVYRRLPKKWRW